MAQTQITTPKEPTLPKQVNKTSIIKPSNTPPDGFHMSEWYRLIKQAVLTINLLRNSRLSPKLLVYAFANGVHNFNAHPLASPGTKLVAHEKPTHCNT